MNGRARLLTIALLTCALSAAVAGCRAGGGGNGSDLSLDGEELRAFLSAVLVARDEVPNAIEDAPDERWTPADSPEGAVYGNVTLADKGWLGTYARPFFVRAAGGRTFTLTQLVIAFENAGGARSALDEMKATDLEALGRQLVDSSAATEYELRDLDIATGDDTWTVLIAGLAPLDGGTEELLSAQVVFRRGPLLASVGSVGYIELDEALLREIIGKIDANIRDALAGL